MIPRWLQALSWKFFSGQYLRPTHRPTRRPGVRPSLEVLEDRTATAVLILEPSGSVAASEALYSPPDDDREPPSEDQDSPTRAGADTHAPDASDVVVEMIGNLPAIEPQDCEREPTLPSTRSPELAEAASPAVFAKLSTPTDTVHPEGSPDPPGLRLAPVRMHENPGGPAGKPGAFISLDLEQRSAPSPSPAAAHPVHEVVASAVAPTELAIAGSRDEDGARSVEPSRIRSVVRPAQDQPATTRSGTQGTAAPSRPPSPVRELRPARTEVRELPVDLPDGSLLQRFVVDREQEAFTVLVQRYERFVLRICQRVLGDSHAAQDALQLTFLVLMRKASVLDRDSPLAGWLYKVAYHLALRLRAVAARQRRSEQSARGRSSQTASECLAEIEQEELRQALREEVQRLPDKYRLPLTLCYFDGWTHAEAARAIGLPRGSVAKRVGESLERLRERLLERGLVP